MAGEYAQYMRGAADDDEPIDLKRESVFTTIDLDVARSFTTMGEIAPDVLKRILKTYANVLDDFDYC